MLSAPFLKPAETKISVLLSALVKRFGVSLIRDLLLLFFLPLILSKFANKNDDKKEGPVRPKKTQYNLGIPGNIW